MQIINEINESMSAYSFFKDLKDWKTEYMRLIKQLHPDVCKEAGAGNAVNKLNDYKTQMENGYKVFDGISDITFGLDNKVTYNCDTKNPINLSLYKNDRQQRHIYKSNSTGNLSQYIPENELQTILNSTTLYQTNDFCLPLEYFMKDKLSEDHVNWIYSRIMEFITAYHFMGYCYLNINPMNIWIRPKNHGVYITGFYYSVKANTQVRAYNLAIKNSYPSIMFRTKTAEKFYDIEMAKNLACRLLGDPTGQGSSLKGKIKDDLFKYYTSSEDDSIDSYLNFRNILAKNFEKKFVELKY